LFKICTTSPNIAAVRSQQRTRQDSLLDKAVMHLEADLRWLDMIEARLNEIRRQPLPEPESKPRGRPKKIRIYPVVEI